MSSPRAEPKPKKCRVCREKFPPFSSLSKVCSPKCAMELVKRDREKQEAKALREQRQQTLQWRRDNMSKGELTKLAQTQFNRFVRLRDHGKPCISCGETETRSQQRGGRVDCGHYRSVGSAPELRFEELNAHLQCKKCNQFLSGNIVEYRGGLLARIGPEKLEWLEGPHEAKNYSRQDLRDIAAHYRKAANNLHKKIETQIA